MMIITFFSPAFTLSLSYICCGPPGGQGGQDPYYENHGLNPLVLVDLAAKICCFKLPCDQLL